MAANDLTYERVAHPCLQVIESVLVPGSAIYVAGPLETGREFYEAGGGAARRGVRRENEARMRRFVARLRTAQALPVIDPGLLRVDGWPNAFYGRFFFAVIERFAQEARFLDGWEFSRGATSELVHCFQHDIPCRDERGAPLEHPRAYSLIEDAVGVLRRLGQDASRFEARLSALDELRKSSGASP